MDKQKAILITNIILIVLLVCFGIYLIFNYGDIRLLMSDPCQLCTQKTGALCTDGIVNVPIN